MTIGITLSHLIFGKTHTPSGLTGKSKDNEIAGTGNFNSALFWEYDTRLGRRWNMDPIPKKSLSLYNAFDNNPILKRDVLGNTVEFANKSDESYVKQFVNEHNDDGINNNMYNAKYATKFKRLEESKTLYHFESFNISEHPDRQGGMTGPDTKVPGRIDILFTQGNQNSLQKFPEIGLGPYSSLWEETYHAWDYDIGGLNFYKPTTLDEAQAWKFSALSPGTQYTKSTFVPEENKNYTDHTVMSRINNANEIQVSIWLKSGMQPIIDNTIHGDGSQYFGLGATDANGNSLLGYGKGLYHYLPLPDQLIKLNIP